MSRIYKIYKIFRIFLSPNEQDQAILLYRVGCAAAVGETSWSRCAFGESDGGEGQALALRFKWKLILKILLILQMLLISCKS